jgi:hypothetical protein
VRGGKEKVGRLRVCVALGFRLVTIYTIFFIVSYVVEPVRFIPVQSIVDI